MFEVGTKVEGLPNSKRYAITCIGNGFGYVCKSSGHLSGSADMWILWFNKKSITIDNTYDVNSKYFKEAKLNWKERLDVMTRHRKYF